MFQRCAVALSVAWACVVLSAAAHAQGNTVTLTEGDNNTTVALHVGDTLVVRLPSSASTGYTWNVARNNASLLQPVGTPVYEQNQFGLLGTPGYQAFLFKAVSAGGERLTLLYRKPSLQGAPAAGIFRVLVVVNQGRQSKTVTLTDGDNNGRVALNVGDTLVVRLSSNASTGYGWNVAQNNPALLQPVGTPQYQGSGGGLLGAPGFQVFSFKAVGAGGEELALLYQKPGLGGVAAAETFRALVVVGQGSQAKTVTVTDRDNNSSVSLNVGDTLVVRLPSNPTTGYSWRASDLASPMLQPVGEPIIQNPPNGLAGAPGYQVFRYRVAFGGAFYLRMFYQRPFDPGVEFDASRRWQIFLMVNSSPPVVASGIPPASSAANGARGTHAPGGFPPDHPPIQKGVRVTLGDPVSIPHPLLYYFPDSLFPFLPDATGENNMMFWTNGISYRTFGATLDRQGPPDPPTRIATGGPRGCFDGNGIWMLVVHRQSASNLIAFAHTENHQFEEPGRHGEWNYCALLTSADDGASWTRRGPIAYRPRPRQPAFGGAGFVSAIYDRAKGRWLAWNGWGGNTAFVSHDPDASPGTWYGWRNGAFVEPGINCLRTSRLPGMDPNTSSIAVHFNTHLGLYVMVSQTWGSGNIRMATSADGLSWSAPATIETFPQGSGAAYPQVVGTTNTLAGQEATLAYSYTGHKFMARPIRFEVTAPKAPTALVAAPGDARVTLSWLGSLGATGYHVKRAAGPGGPYETIASCLPSASYTDATAGNGKAHHYVVTAVNAAGESAASARAGATPSRPTAPPAAPTALQATPGNAEVALGWGARPGAASYNVLRATAKGGPYKRIAARVTVPAYRDSGLENGTPYYYVVAAVNAAGTSPQSGEAAAAPFLPVPAAPADLTVTASDGAVRLSWRASEVAVTYSVKRAAASGGPYTTVATSVIANGYTDTTVKDDTRYHYVVAARNFFGESADSEAVAADLHSQSDGR